MATQLSGVAIIICIAFGVLTFLLLFIFANRQIKRFSLKSRSGPHVPIAHDAKKALLIEIDRRLDVVKTVSCQPKLLRKDEEALFHDGINEINNITPVHLYRMKVLDSLANFDACIAAAASPSKVRPPEQDLRVYLLRLHQSGITADLNIAVIHQFVDLYQCARHEPGDFSHEHYIQFVELMNRIKRSISHRFNNLQQNGSKRSSILSPDSVDRKHSSNGKVSELPRTAQPEI